MLYQRGYRVGHFFFRAFQGHFWRFLARFFRESHVRLTVEVRKWNAGEWKNGQNGQMLSAKRLKHHKSRHRKRWRLLHENSDHDYELDELYQLPSQWLAMLEAPKTPDCLWCVTFCLNGIAHISCIVPRLSQHAETTLCAFVKALTASLLFRQPGCKAHPVEMAQMEHRSGLLRCFVVGRLYWGRFQSWLLLSEATDGTPNVDAPQFAIVKRR